MGNDNPVIPSGHMQSEGLDQPAPSCSLTSAFTVFEQNHWTFRALDKVCFFVFCSCFSTKIY